MKIPRLFEKHIQKHRDYLDAIDGNPSAKIDIAKLIDIAGLNRAAIFLFILSLASAPISFLFMYLASELELSKVSIALFHILLCMGFVAIGFIHSAPHLKAHFAVLSRLKVVGTLRMFSAYRAIAGFVGFVLIASWSFLSALGSPSFDMESTQAHILFSVVMAVYALVLSVGILLLANLAVVLVTYRS